MLPLCLGFVRNNANLPKTKYKNQKKRFECKISVHFWYYKSVSVLPYKGGKHLHLFLL